MLIDECTLPKSNTLVTDYIKGDQKATAFFEYDYKDMQAYINRKRDLSEKQFPREALVQHLMTFNKQFTDNPKVFENIQKLLSNESTVVITGQQAGFLTGPLYTIYKAISTIEHAKQLEAKLQIPVVPIFWVAGEDHDFQEINHVWVLKENQVVKEKYPAKYVDKRPVAQIEMRNEEMERWVEEVFSTFGETDHSQALLQFTKDKIRASDTISEFFIHVMAAFFEKHGLVFVDSASEQLRKIEAPFFKELIEYNDSIRAALQKQQECIVTNGYPSGIDTGIDCAHLFYHVNDERQLLHHVGNDVYSIKEREVTFTKEELYSICEENPERLSNNVVTRPLMQEYLFPTLAFIAGPGEITYWAQLKPLFSLLNRKMPPIVPRMHVTIMERNINKSLRKFGLSLQQVLTDGVSPYREKWLEQQKEEKAQSVLDETRSIIDLAHAKLRKFAWETDHNLGQISEKNRLLILEQIDYMEQRIKKMYENRFAEELGLFAQIEFALVPNGGLQERIWNIFYYLNKYGLEFVDQLFIPHQIDESKHHIIFL